MSGINPTLLNLARRATQSPASLEKSAVVPAAPDPAAGGGAMPMDPAAGGGGGAMPMDPAMAGGMPPGAGGAPPEAGGMPPGGGGAMPMDPMMAQQMGMMPPGGAAGAGAAAGGGQKIKPEQMMQMLDFRLYNLQQQLTAIMNAMQIELPPDALILPPGSPVAPTAEAAMPGGPQDPSQNSGQGGAGSSAISPVEPLQGASPELAMGGGAGGAPGGEGAPPEKAAQHTLDALIGKMAEADGGQPSPRTPIPGERPTEKTAEKTNHQSIGEPYTLQGNPATNASAVAAMLRSRTAGRA